MRTTTITNSSGACNGIQVCGFCLNAFCSIAKTPHPQSMRRMIPISVFISALPAMYEISLSYLHPNWLLPFNDNCSELYCKENKHHKILERASRLLSFNQMAFPFCQLSLPKQRKEILPSHKIRFRMVSKAVCVVYLIATWTIRPFRSFILMSSSSSRSPFTTRASGESWRKRCWQFYQKHITLTSWQERKTMKLRHYLKSLEVVLTFWKTRLRVFPTAWATIPLKTFHCKVGRIRIG